MYLTKLICVCVNKRFSPLKHCFLFIYLFFIDVLPVIGLAAA